MCLRTHPFRKLPLREGFNIPDMEAEFKWEALICCLYLILLNDFVLHTTVCGDWVSIDSTELCKARVKLAFFFTFPCPLLCLKVLVHIVHVYD